MRTSGPPGDTAGVLDVRTTGLAFTASYVPGLIADRARVRAEHAARARPLAAADEERRRVVRDLHDGAQQWLVPSTAGAPSSSTSHFGGPAAAAAVGSASTASAVTSARRRVFLMAPRLGRHAVIAHPGPRDQEAGPIVRSPSPIAAYSSSVTCSPQVTGLPVLVVLLHGDVGHEPVRRGAVPVVLAGLEEDAVAGADDLDRAALALAEADALGDEDRLAVRVRVPGGSRAGREVDERGGERRACRRARRRRRCRRRR